MSLSLIPHSSHKNYYQQIIAQNRQSHQYLQIDRSSHALWYSLLEQDILFIDELINSFGPFEPGNAIVGVCEDGVPFLLDLRNPDIGSLLVTSKPNSGKTNLLKFILTSVSLLNHPDHVVFQVITAEPRVFYPFTHDHHSNGIFQNGSTETTNLIDSLLHLADHRQHHPGEGPIQLLVIDDLVDFIYGLNNETYWGFEWLVRYGTKRRIWVIASQSTETIDWLDNELLDSFRTRISGEPPEADSIPTLQAKILPNQNDLKNLQSTISFHVPYKDSWLRITTSHNLLASRKELRS